MNIGPKFKRAILAGKRPALTDPDVKEGQVIEIDPAVWVTVTQRVKADVWGYSLRDDRPNLLGKSGGYTPLHIHAIGAKDEYGPELEAVDKHYLDTTITKEARLRHAERQDKVERGRQDARRLAHSLRELAQDAARAGIDPTLVLAPIKRQIDQARAEIGNVA